jgi:hypothetical protein
MFQHEFNKLFKLIVPADVGWITGDDIYNINPESLKKYKLVVVDYSCEHYGNHPAPMPTYHDLVKMGMNFIFLTHHEPDHLLKPNYLFFPHHYFKKIDNINPMYESINCTSKKFKLSCLNKNPHAHRIYNFLKLQEKHYFNQMLFTFYNISNIPRPDAPLLDVGMIHKWEEIRNDLKQKIEEEPKTADNDHPAYLDSYIHLITETTILDKIFITEKTWKSIASGQLFILLGTPGSIQHLRNLDVDTFDDYIDHNYYDNEPDWQKRIDKIHKLIDHFMQLSEDELYKINVETQSRRLENAKKYFAGEFISKYIVCLREKINELSIR